MVRSRPVGEHLRTLAYKLPGVLLLSSAIMIWLVIIIAIVFLMINNGRLRDIIKDHTVTDDVQTVEWRATTKKELDDIKQHIINIENRVKNNEKRIRALEKQ